MDRIKEILAKLKQGHTMYQRGNSDYRDRLEKAFEPIFNELDSLGIDPIFSQSVLFWGKEFVDSVTRNDEWDRVKKKTELTLLQFSELVFGVRALEMGEKQLKAYKLAKKNNAIMYKVLPMQGDKIGIEIIL